MDGRTDGPLLTAHDVRKFFKTNTKNGVSLGKGQIVTNHLIMVLMACIFILLMPFIKFNAYI